MKIISFVFTFSLLSLNLLSATFIQQTPVPEKQSFRALYMFTQKVEKERELIVMTDTMELKIGNRWSEYKDWKQDLKDSLLIARMKDVDSRRQVVVRYAKYDEFISNSSQDIGLRSKSWETSSLYKDRGNNKIITIDEINRVGAVRSEEFASQTWEIATDTISIKGYLCYKATTTFRGREYIAWFALDIPINDGPWKFYGLPGLILKIQDNEQIFQFDLIGLEKIDNGSHISIDKTRKYTDCSPEKYNQLKRNALKQVDYFNLQGTNLGLYSGDNRIKYEFLER